MRLTKKNVLAIINENYSIRDIELIKKLSEKGELNIDNNIRKILYNDYDLFTERGYKSVGEFIITNTTNKEGVIFDQINKDGEINIEKLVNWYGKYFNTLFSNFLNTESDEKIKKLISLLVDNNLLSYSTLNKLIPANDFLDLKTKNIKEYKNSNGWVVHQTRTFDNMINIVSNGFTRGTSFDNLIQGGGYSNPTEGRYSFGYDINEYDGNLNYGTFIVIFKTNYVSIYHKKDDETQAIFDTDKVQEIYPIAFDKEFYYLISNDGKVVIKNESLIKITKWLDINSKQYRKLLDFKNGDPIEYKKISNNINDNNTKHSGNEKYDKLELLFKKIYKGKNYFQ